MSWASHTLKKLLSGIWKVAIAGETSNSFVNLQQLLGNLGVPSSTLFGRLRALSVAHPVFHPQSERPRYLQFVKRIHISYYPGRKQTEVREQGSTQAGYGPSSLRKCIFFELHSHPH